MATRPAGPDRSLTAASLLSATSSTMDSKPSTPYLDSHTPGHDLELAKPYPGLEGDDRTAATDGVDSLHKQARRQARPQPSTWYGKGWAWLIQSDQIEDHGVGPLPAEERTDAHFFSNFNIWLSMNTTIACFSTGTLGPLFYGLSLRDSTLIIVFCNLFSCGVPSYVATFGPRLGMRTMGMARYSFGYYFAILPALLNIVSFIGFCAVNSIVAGQVLAAVNPDHLSVNAGIVIVAIVSMLVSFCGYRVLHVMERWAWIPVTLAFILLAGFGARHLGSAPSFAAGEPATAGMVLSFVSIIVGFTISWSGCAADFNTYMRPDVPSMRVFVYTMAGLYLPCMLVQVMGAAFAAAALNGAVPTWEAAFGDGSVGGLVGVAVEPMRGFGKFLLVVFSLGMISNNAPTQYAFSLSLQIVFPFLTRLPRFLLPIVGTAIYLPIAIAAAAHFAAALSNFLGLLGYWSSIFVAILLVEHLLFRKGRFASYDLSIWDRSSRLPPGLAAITASLCGAAFIVVGMDQVWWRGPFAKMVAGPEATTGGDIAFETGMAVAAVVFVPARWLEKRVFHR
ncbi:hypothetical protein BMF94_1748 [Rhodotorula taiwanensis]|uniref:Purine-cytosine permease n=1 Tax=Rhodotorula taiwanensis TaxID=741276 RepID=A0A2S5BEB3_9BASI|nr:hypothetical protein BMF94_1748 [Rhodotorula taiwanensis]